MRLRHIEIFHAIYTTGSITNAAKLLSVSQPSVSKVLSHAEMQLGFQLFARVKGRLIPTPEAEMLFIEAERIFNQMATINDLADNILHHRAGKISIGITMALGFEVIPRITKEFMTDFPEVKIELQTLHNQSILNHLLRQQNDLAIMFSPRELPDTIRYEFGQGELTVVLPNLPDYPDDQTINMRHLTDKPYISIRKSGPVGDLVNEYIETTNNKLKTVIQVDTYYIAMQMVKQGIGWCVIDEFTARANASEEVRLGKLEKATNFSIVGLCSDLQPVSNVTQQFIEVTKAYFTP
jgi:DNA-binding transcriptional LysR family regulator